MGKRRPRQSRIPSAVFKRSAAGKQPKLKSQVVEACKVSEGAMASAPSKEPSVSGERPDLHNLTTTTVVSDRGESRLEPFRCGDKLPPVPFNDPRAIYGNGPLQHRALFFSTLTTFILLVHNLLLSVVATNVDHWCKQPPEYSNLTSEEWRNISVPRDDNGHWLGCVRYDPVLSGNASNQSQVPCGQWDYDLKGRSIITDWNLVCDRHWLVPFASAVYMGGAAAAAIIMGELSDQVGRKPIINASVVFLLISGMAVCLSSSVTMFMALRFFVAASISSAHITSFVLLFELSPPAHQCLYTFIATSVATLMAPLCLSLVDLFANDWVVAQLTVMLPTTLLLSTFVQTVESPLWIVHARNFMDAERVVLRAAQINGCSIHEAQNRWRLHNTSYYGRDENAASRSRSSLADVLRSKRLRRRVIVVFFCFFFVMFAYYQRRSRYLSSVWLQAIQTALDVLGCLLVYRSTTKLGPRVTLLALLVAFSVLAGITALVQLLRVASVLVRLVDMVAGIVLDMLPIIIYVHSVELFPTVVRSRGMFAAYFFGRLGGIASPYLQELGGVTKEEIVPSLLSLLGILTALGVYSLPETMSAKVLNTIQDLEDVAEGKATRKFSRFAIRRSRLGSRLEAVIRRTSSLVPAKKMIIATNDPAGRRT